MSDFPNVRGPLTIAVDLETIDPNLKDRGPGAMRRDGHVVGIALGLPGEAGRYYPLDGPEEELVDHPYPEVTIRYFRDLLLRPDITVVGANLLYDLLWLRTLGIECQGPLEDVQLAEQLINENLPTYNLESLSQRYLGRGKLGGELENYAAERGWKSHWPHLAEMPISLVGRYAAVDAANTLAVREIQQKVLIKENLNGIYDLECELIRVVLDMTWRGIRIDEDKCHRVLDHCRWERDKNVQEMERIAGGGWEADIWSVPTISEAATRLGYPIGVSDKDGDSFSKEFLNKHRGEIPFYECLLEARKHDRLGNVFVEDKLLNLAQGGRIYPTWRQGRGDRYVSGGTGEGLKGTRSGRFASESPCFDDKTEVLTATGFKLFRNLEENDRVGQYREGEISFAFPVEVQTIPYAGPMLYLHSMKTDMALTPDHRVLLIGNDGQEYFQKASEVPFGVRGNIRIPDRGVLKTGDTDLSENDLFSLLLETALQADGSLHKAGREIRFGFRKKRKIERLLYILDSLGLPYRTGNYASFQITLRRQDIGFKYITESKEFKLDVLLRLSLGDRQGFVQECLFWDGNFTAKEKDRSSSYASKDKHNSDVVSTIAILSGYQSKLTARLSDFKEKGLYPSYYATVRTPTTGVYIERIQKEIRPYTGTVYCVTMPWKTVIIRRNGKVSFTGNCLQQFPSRHGELANLVRGCILPEEGEQWMSSDFQSQENRILVHYGCRVNDKRALAIAEEFKADPRTDYHQKVRDMIEDVSGVSISRKQAKVMNLALSYSMGKAKLAKELGLTLDEAEPIFQAYHQSIPFVRALTKLTTAKAERVGEIRTLLGRKRSFGLFWRVPYQQGDKPLPFDEAKRAWPNSRLERAGAYKALNALIQGSAADQTKRAMVMCHNTGLKMLATVHDELCFSVSSEAEIRRAIEIMENAVELAVPMKVDVEVGPSWGELEEFKQ